MGFPKTFCASMGNSISYKRTISFRLQQFLGQSFQKELCVALISWHAILFINSINVMVNCFSAPQSAVQSNSILIQMQNYFKSQLLKVLKVDTCMNHRLLVACQKLSKDGASLTSTKRECHDQDAQQYNPLLAHKSSCQCQLQALSKTPRRRQDPSVSCG